MKRYINHLISIVVLAVFFAMACACITKNVGVIYAKDCEFFMPSVSKSQMIKIVVLDKQTKLPLSGVEVDINYTKYDKVKVGEKCELKPQARVTHLGSTNISGMYSLPAGNTYYSSEDYIFGRIDIHLPGYYRDANIGYFQLEPNKNTETVHFSLLKINVSP